MVMSRDFRLHLRKQEFFLTREQRMDIVIYELDKGSEKNMNSNLIVEKNES